MKIFTPKYLENYENELNYIKVSRQLSGKKISFKYYNIIVRFVLFNYMFYHLKNHPSTLQTLQHMYHQWILKLPKKLNHEDFLFYENQ